MYSFRWADLAYLLAFYVLFGAALVQIGIAAASQLLHIPAQELQTHPTPYVAVVACSQAVLSGAVLLFLYVMVRSRSTAPFWRTVGWRQFSEGPARSGTAARYVLGGAGLAILIQAASYYAGTKNTVPMEDFFRNRPSVLMMMGLGIVVAPLIEEVIFRGCVFPVFARTFGVPAGIFFTGILFGMAHSLQLAGAWKEIALVSVVGIVLTYVRARTGTVLASYLVHLGYNSLLFAAFFFATAGLEKFPPS